MFRSPITSAGQVIPVNDVALVEVIEAFEKLPEKAFDCPHISVLSAVVGIMMFNEP